MKFIKKLKSLLLFFKEQRRINARVQMALGRIELNQQIGRGSYDLKQNEFTVFSQWGEDGILQFLIRNTVVKNHIFVEFGVENYTEANTRFLLMNNNWSGLILDGSLDNINSVREEDLYWRYSLKAEQAFVTRENINELIKKNGISGEIGLLSIDIDGNDYWVWQAIDVVNPAIVVVEYNYRFGPSRAVTVPYRADFTRGKAHHSMIYYGASLKALCLLGERKGYSFVGCNSAGNNAFFVRKDLMNDKLRECSPEDGFVAGRFRESRDQKGLLTLLSHQDEELLLSSLALVDVG